MYFSIDERIFRQFPGTAVGIVVAYGIKNNQQRREIGEFAQQVRDNLIRIGSTVDLGQHPQITAWRNAYKQFGATPKKHLSSVENLLQRTLKQQPSAPISPLVDIYNAISLKYLLPAGGEDLDTVVGDIRLTIAGPSEPAVILLGQQEARAPEAGEVIYADEKGAICRRWNWKEAERTKLTAETHNAVLVVEALPPVKREVLEAAVHDLAGLIAHYCGGTISVDILDEKHSRVELKKDGVYLPLQPLKEMVQGVTCEQIFEHAHAAPEQKAHESINKEHLIRVEKVEKLRAQGIEPWPDVHEVTAHCKQVLDEFTEEVHERTYTLAGRLMTIRLHGKTAFAHLQDNSGKLQLYVRSDVLGEDVFKQFEDYTDLGDIIWVHGTPFRTKTGEITLKVDKFGLLSKCLFPLPEKFHGLQDVETKYRQRYLDLMTNEASRDRFVKRSMIVTEMRSYLIARGYLEVETPMLHPIAGGAAAKPFITHHNALHSDFYLRIAPELYLKRLLVGGLERVFEINRNFRNEGISTRHNPEFTMLEFYTAYKDYHYGMDIVEDMLRTIAKKALGNLQLPYGELTLDFESRFRRLAMIDAVKEFGGFSDADLQPGAIDALLKREQIKITAHASYGEKIYALFEERVESKLIQPTFIVGFPIEVSPLTKKDSKNPSIAPRYELFSAGMELANSYNELNDPFDQAQRFMDQLKAHAAGNEEAHQFDADYIKALEYGLPPACGVGIGIDRLVMLLTNTTSIKEVILFPTLKKQ
jgi:lysyl-tRNA synthetase class 2